MALAVDQHRIHRPAAIVDRGIPDDFDEAGFRIYLDLADGTGIGVGRDAHRLVRDPRQRSAQITRSGVAERRACDLEQPDATVGPFDNKTLLGKFDVFLGRLEKGAVDAAPLVNDGVGGFGDDLRPEAHRPRRGRAATGQHAVAIAGQQPHLARVNP